MNNPFSEKYTTDKTDELLISEAVKGDKHSLESLIRRHQDWIYNIALRMVFYPEEAKDVTQEVLIKIMTKLASFEGRSSFRTWAYRIVVNHVLNMKKSIGERNHSFGFDAYAKAIDNTPDNDESYFSPETRILVEEVKVSCMFGMLMCLNREQRLVYILGSIFGINDTVGSEIMEISHENFRQRLSRARRDLFNFMNNKCGLVNKDNPCRCSKKTKALVDVGYVNPKKLLFNVNTMYNVHKAVEDNLPVMENFLDDKCNNLFLEHPYQQSPDFVLELSKILDSSEFKDIFKFN